MSSGNISISNVRLRPYSSLIVSLSLIALQSFEEWNPELANAARDIYADINKLELYVRLPSYCLMFSH
jgi:hypothetical protein